MRNDYNEPLYDTDLVPKGYLNKRLNGEIGEVSSELNKTNSTISAIGGAVTKKAQNFGSQPVPPYYRNDTWMNGTDIYICVTQRLLGNFNASDWEKASIYDNTKAKIDEGITTTTGGLEVTNDTNGITVGMTADGSLPTSIRLWAGTTKANRATAPFRVNQLGEMWATNAHITGYINASTGYIGGWTIADDRIHTAKNGIYANGQLYMYPGNTLFALNDGFRCKATNGIALYNNQSYYGRPDREPILPGINILAYDGDMTLGETDNRYTMSIRSSCSPSIRANADAACLLLAAGHNLFLYAHNDATHNGIIWAEGGGLANSEVITDAGKSSSRNVKTNIKMFTQTKYDEALSLLKKMNLYEYDYKYNIYKNPHKYGFIIDELEQFEETKDFFEFKEYNATVKNNTIDFSGSKEGEPLKTKNYDGDVLDKYLLTVCKSLYNKVEELEQKIAKLEGGIK